MLGLSVFYEFKRPNDRGFRLDAKMFKKIEKSFYKRLKARKATLRGLYKCKIFLENYTETIGAI
ncbi:hypothetical protein BM523_14470 [Alteromonas mediterranea]|uniref:Uncharacterized protein n=1 Tax=Alteromonas mediterranea TaxID=314275 RepID=A0AAC8XLX9_9ALTE|nr:hypothetical protein AV942_15780 [Alteromonas mediterranea]AMJ83804.1 hypothetical protein AV941_15865 [Alteromonas mediterranea]APD95113.1 hypothetical protein BM523_14470 [Alteromonas mediterranea]APD98748.1 hypothetical protein BM525_14550 [Alteromonas mediterranea]APE02974.1 hypothetical protein BM526_14580 [Alteromonas mediterranea]|tara:strand:- start:46 stop:237 length:192 start_codon:yes stop_codon:yes gene_type:complete